MASVASTALHTRGHGSWVNDVYFRNHMCVWEFGDEFQVCSHPSQMRKGGKNALVQRNNHQIPEIFPRIQRHLFAPEVEELFEGDDGEEAD